MRMIPLVDHKPSAGGLSSHTRTRRPATLHEGAWRGSSPQELEVHMHLRYAMRRYIFRGILTHLKPRKWWEQLKHSRDDVSISAVCDRLGLKHVRVCCLSPRL